MYFTDNEKLEKFIELRSKYIDQLDNKQISKLTFNHLNNEIFIKINLRPFAVLDSFNKALYNYNYYNSKAKLYLEEENKYKNMKSAKRAKMAQNNKLNCYHHKDESIIAMVELEDASDMEAYFIEMHSKSLNNDIYEIYFKTRDKVILHSKNEKIKNILIEKGVFLEEKRSSLIESYINN